MSRLLQPMRRHRYLMLALACFAVMAVLRWFAASESNEHRYLQRVQEQVWAALEKADDQIMRAKNVLKEHEHIEFGAFLDRPEFPMFIYRNRQLSFWSDHELQLDYLDVQGFFSEKCVEIQQAQGKKHLFLAKKSQLYIKNQDYELVVLIPLLRQEQQEGRNRSQELANPSIFLGQQVKVFVAQGANPIYSAYDTYLFSVNFNILRVQDPFWKAWQLALMVLAVALLGQQLAVYIRGMLEQGMAGRAALSLIAFLAALRALMLAFRIPYSYIDFDLFDPNTFASSPLSPSLGDLLLNMASVAVAGIFIFVNYPRIIRYRRMLPLNELGKSAMATLWVVLSYASLYGNYWLIETILSNSKFSSDTIFIDFTHPVDFSVANVASLSIFVLMSAVFFFVSHIASKLLIKLGDSVYDAPTRFVAGSLVYYLLSLWLGIDNIILFNINALYLIAITFFSLPFFVQRSDYNTYTYLFAWASVSATVGAYAIVSFSEMRDLEGKKKYATELMLENDQIAEFYLDELRRQVMADPRIAAMLEQADAAGIERKIKGIYMKRYLDKYHVDIAVYRGNSQQGLNTTQTLTGWEETQQRLRPTEYDSVFFQHNAMKASDKRYLVYIDIDDNGLPVGKILLSLQLKQVIPNSIQDNFLVDGKKDSQDRLKAACSYAIYGGDDERLLYSAGDFMYDRKFLQQFKYGEQGIWQSALQSKGFHHLRVPNKEDEQHIVISSSDYPIGSAVSNACFLFLLLVFALLMVISLNNLYRRSSARPLNFNTKIQIYLNFAFFLPLIVVSVIIVSMLSNANLEETKGYYLETAKNVASSLQSEAAIYLQPGLRQGLSEVEAQEMLQDRVAELAKITQTDINLFVLHPWGEELFSSESYIYDKQLLSRRINPYVRMLLVEQGQSRALLNEQVGQVSFHVAYAGIKPAVHDAGGAPVAVVGIPFNGSKYEYEKQALDVLANVIQVFAVILLALLPLSYVSVRSLTAPLRLIQQKLRKVSFQNRNEPIEYVSDDEIGMLVNEYNKMLVKLEQSREALSQSEKESAWREMAKQVAHEIKNPLTPMKLNLQQLQRVLDANHPLAKRSIEMLITQIDTLSDIASSFSAFARMPVPKEEPIDLCAILQETLTLNEAREEALITCRFEAERLPVIGDARLMSRIFNNLIINAVQAVPAGRQPEIEIEAKVRHGWAFLRFSDNGAGIPEEARPKVFFPNFTTKSSGSGIGLAIAKRGIETLNGRIWFETETGKGTVFFIEMPMIAD